MWSRNWQVSWESTPTDSVVSLTGRSRLRPVERHVAAAFVLLINVYRRLVSPLLGPMCRFHPSCSTYAIEAINRYGPIGGCARAIARLARCHPLCDGGYDPVQ